MAPSSRRRERLSVEQGGWSAEMILCAPMFLRVRRQQFRRLANEFAGGFIEPVLAERPLETALKLGILHGAKSLMAADHPCSISGIAKSSAHTFELGIFRGVDHLLGKILYHLQQRHRGL